MKILAVRHYQGIIALALIATLLFPLLLYGSATPPGNDTVAHIEYVVNMLVGGGVRYPYYADLLPTYISTLVGVKWGYSLYFYSSALLIAAAIYLYTKSWVKTSVTLLSSTAILGFYPTGTVPNAWSIFALGIIFLHFFKKWTISKSNYHLIASLIMLASVGVVHSVSLAIFTASLPLLLAGAVMFRRISIREAITYSVYSSILVLAPIGMLMSTQNRVAEVLVAAAGAPAAGQVYIPTTGSEFSLSVIPARFAVLVHYLGLGLLLVGAAITQLRKVHTDVWPLLAITLIALVVLFWPSQALSPSVLDRVGRVTAGFMILISLYVLLDDRRSKGARTYSLVVVGLVSLVSIPSTLWTWWHLECAVC